MKHAIAATRIAVVFCVLVSEGALAEPVLMLDEARDISTAQYSCEWAANEIKGYDYLIKAFQCNENDLCRRAIETNAARKVSGPVADVRAFHSNASGSIH